MSLTYAPRGTGSVFWLASIGVSAIVHLGVPVQILSLSAQTVHEERVVDGITGALMFDLADLVAAPSVLQDDSVAQAESQRAPTVTQSPEAVELAQAAEHPILSQIPYDVADESLRFGVAAPEPDVQSEDVAEEVATAFDPVQIDADSQLGAEARVASEHSVAGIEAEKQADKAEAASEGLSAEQMREIQDWQKRIVLLISGAKTYPAQARRARIEGEVHIRFTLDRYGAIIVTQVAQSSGSSILDQAALETVAQLEKMPTPPRYLNGDQVSLIIPLLYRFR